MNRDRLVQLVALLLALVCLAGSTLLRPTIRRQQRDLGLTFAVQSDQTTKPTYVLLAAGLGTFRGLAVDILWYRAEQLRRQGRVHEFDTLANWITKLQPRFPKVWETQAWNLAYNISVMTHTPDERWMWVQKSIHLLRDEGIPNNPRAIKLYRELGRTFHYKIGGYIDDMHWTYKRELAEKWERLLGAQTVGATTEQVLADFKPIADAADRYFNLNDRPSLATRQKIQSLINENADAADLLGRLREQDLERFIERVPQVQDALRQRRRFTLADELTPLLASAQERRKRARSGSMTLLREDDPKIKQALQAWQAAGLELNEQGLSDYGQKKMWSRLLPLEQIVKQKPGNWSSHDLTVAKFVLDHEDDAQLETWLAFLRARVLLENYHMKPLYMYDLMKRYGPLDWRHWCSHAIYWSVRGVEMAGMHEENKFDVLNTDRQVLAALQDLFFAGRLNFDPFDPRNAIETLPDPRYIEPYEKMMMTARNRAGEVTWPGQGNNESFDTGHENFLHKAVMFSYFFGDIDKAQKYYDEVRERYGDNPNDVYRERYKLPLDEFALKIYQRDIGGMRQVNRAMIEGMIDRGLVQGLANGDREIFSRYIRLAKAAHRQYNEKYKNQQGTAERSNHGLLPFDQMLTRAYVEFMESPAISLYQRSRIYRNTPLELQRQAFPLFREKVYAQACARRLQRQADVPRAPGPRNEGARERPRPEGQPRWHRGTTVTSVAINSQAVAPWCLEMVSQAVSGEKPVSQLLAA